jgi:hypothetical protein
VALCNGVVCVVCELGAADDVAPVYAYFVAGFDVDDFAGHGGLEAGFAGDARIVDIAD